MSSPVALIVGGSTGIGAALAEKLTGKDWKVYAVSRHTKPLSCDSSSAASVDALFDKIVAEHGRLDLLVHAAAPALKLKRIEEMSPEEIDQDVDVILKGGLYLSRRAAMLMKAQKSGIMLQILTTSLDSTPVRMTAYTAAKAGLLGLTYTLAAELGPFGVRALAISPHFVETQMLTKFPAKILEIERDRLPEKRFLKPEEVAELMLKMITDDKKFPNGTVRKVYSVDDLRI